MTKEYVKSKEIYICDKYKIIFQIVHVREEESTLLISRAQLSKAQC